MEVISFLLVVVFVLLAWRSGRAYLPSIIGSFREFPQEDRIIAMEFRDLRRLYLPHRTRCGLSLVAGISICFASLHHDSSPSCTDSLYTLLRLETMKVVLRLISCLQYAAELILHDIALHLVVVPGSYSQWSRVLTHNVRLHTISIQNESPWEPPRRSYPRNRMARLLMI